MTHLKPDAAQFEARLDRLKTESWLGKPREWWPNFLFHHTDVMNIVQILRDNRLISRNAAARSGFIDAGSRDVLAITPEQWKSYVRFYFRPLTPTLFHMEGFRPTARIQLNAYCPMPIYLLFDAKKILTQAGTRFSHGNLATTGTAIYERAEDFEKMPFSLIYHNQAIRPPEDTKQIVFHRHAEAIVPNQVDLTDLKHIWCRSQAEYETLRYLLGDQWSQWETKVNYRKDWDLFNRRWIYFDQVTLERTKATFSHNNSLDPRDAEPFKAKVIVIDNNIEIASTIWSQSFKRQTFLQINLEQLNLADYELKLFLDEHLAYAGRYSDADEIPF